MLHQSQPQNLLRERNVAHQLGVAVYTLQKWRSRGGGPEFVRFGPKGSAVRYRQEDIDRWLNENRSSGAVPR